MSLETEKLFEKEPAHNVIIVDFIRHGESSYLEEGLDLTSKGVKQIYERAVVLAKTINPKEEIVVYWSSPNVRAQGSERILHQVLREHEIEVFKTSEIRSLRTFDQKDVEFMDELWDELGDDLMLQYSRGELENEEKFESQREVKQRVGRVFNWIRYLAEHANLEGKKLRIVGVSHFEVLNPIMEDLFDYRIEEGQEMENAENIRITFDYDPVSKETKISADFRDQHRENIIFDKKQRKFLTKKA